eukprot:CAMPEP_0113626484 /NCGR_PEP_ID=MMETSP0017_2-20120614/13697_1 /TAXON_ID=2856 /ORGANISM="Cylindrotheca closterium" /LENGTH=491 /DNA_ID=CAMNT_0000536667 /DNA_START=155 /DNA_END=1630 /DNA_ORIENTATION=+ /assembly_acc=CAM_ASM_000147
MTGSGSLPPPPRKGSSHQHHDGGKLRHLQSDTEMLAPTIAPAQLPSSFPTTRTRPMRPTQVPTTKAPSTAMTPPPTTESSSTPVEEEEVVTPSPYRAYVSFQWSILPYDSTDSSLTSGDEYKGMMANWFLQQFLCQQQEQTSKSGEKLWLANRMDILKNDCVGVAAIDDSGYHSLVSSHTILWNEPIASWYPELLVTEDHVHYEVWNVQYPLFFANGVQEEAEEQEIYHKMVQDKLQALLNDQIEMQPLQSDRGIMSIVGREFETYLLRHSGSFGTLAPTALSPNTVSSSSSSGWSSYLPIPLVMIGALIIVVHTLILFCLHFYLRPYLEKSNAKTRLKFEHAESTNKTTKSHQSSEDDPLQNVWLQLPQDDARHKSSHDHNHLIRPNTFFVDATTSVPSLLSPQMPNDDDSDWLTMSRSHDSVLEIAARSRHSEKIAAAEEKEENVIESSRMLLVGSGGEEMAESILAPLDNRDDSGNEGSVGWSAVLWC